MLLFPVLHPISWSCDAVVGGGVRGGEDIPAGDPPLSVD